MILCLDKTLRRPSRPMCKGADIWKHPIQNWASTMRLESRS